MSLMFADGFDSYSATSDLLRNWSSNGGWTWSSSGGRNGGGCIQSTSAVAIQAPDPIVSRLTSPVCFGFWIKISAAPAAASFFVRALPSHGGLLGVATNGVIQATPDSGGVSVTGTTNICDNLWHWVEWYSSSQNTSSLNKCYVDSIQQWNGSFQLVSGANLNPTITTFNFTGFTSCTMTVDDAFVYDSETAVSPQATDTPLGPRIINTLRPASDNSVQFAPDSGTTNFSRVNEVSGDGDTSYVQDNNSGHADLYGYDSLSYTPTAITAVQLVSRVENPGSGSISYKNRCKSGSTTSDGTSTVAPSNYANSRTSYNQDPNTSAAWIRANLDTALFGITVV